MNRTKKLSPDHQVEKPYSIPIGEEAELVGSDKTGKFIVACIDKRLAEDVGVTALMFHTIYVDIDGKVYTDAIQKANILTPPVASAVLWSNHDEFMDRTEMLNALTAGRFLDRVRVAVVSGDIPPEKPKKKGRGGKVFQGFDIF